MKIEHLAIWTSDLEMMREFYENHFQAISGPIYHNKLRGFKSYFLSFESGPRIEMMKIDSITKMSLEPFIGLAHLAISLGSKEAVDSVTEKFRSSGTEILGDPRTTGDGYYESLILDPEGNQIELTI